MMQPDYNTLAALMGKQVTLRFPNAGLSGRLAGVQREPWGYLLHVNSPIGDHYVAFPGEVLHIVVAHSEN